MAENETGAERHTDLSSGWQPFAAGRERPPSEAEWRLRAQEVERRAVAGKKATNEHMIRMTETIYLPNAEIVAYFEKLQQWKDCGCSKRDWCEGKHEDGPRNPIPVGCSSATTWNDLLELHDKRHKWADAKRRLLTRNTPFEPKHSSGVPWSLDVIDDELNKDVKVEPRPVLTAAQKKAEKTKKEAAKAPADPGFMGDRPSLFENLSPEEATDITTMAVRYETLEQERDQIGMARNLIILVLLCLAFPMFARFIGGCLSALFWLIAAVVVVGVVGALTR